jgi:hypothetical protein
MMRRSTSIPTRHGGSFWKNARNVAALQLTADEHVAFRVDAVHLKYRLGDMLGSSESWEHQQHPHPWHSCAGGGAVHSIKSGRWARLSGGDLIRRAASKSGFRFGLPHYLLRDAFGDYSL